MKKFNVFKTILLISVLLLLMGCTGLFNRYTYQPPENIGDGLDAGSLTKVNIDPSHIEKAVNDIIRGKYDEVHSLLIVKDGKLVLEEYFEGHKYQWDAPDHHSELVTWDRTMPHYVQSVTKNITSTCVGIAIDKGFIESADQSVFDYLPDYQHLNKDDKNKITIEHLLTMTSGLEWDEWSTLLSSFDNDIVGIWLCHEGPISYVLNKPLTSDPGTSFNYNGGNMIVLGEVIKNATKMSIDDFSEKYLFEPLGIDSFEWSVQFENGEFDTSGGLKISSRDMAKIGVTFLNNGVWNGDQIVSEQWIGKSSNTFPGNVGIDIPGEGSGNVGYAYSWWTKQYSVPDMEINMYYASGWGGQHIMILPEVNAVVVFTGGNYVNERPTFEILEKYIIPSIE